MEEQRLPFASREDAGRRRAAELPEPRIDAPVVFALSRGGVPVAAGIAEALGAPRDSEVARAAIVEGDPPERVVNEEVMRRSGADQGHLHRETARETAEMQRRRDRCLGHRRRGAARIVVAVPVAPASGIPALREIADEVVCLVADPEFRGVGGASAHFHQLTDEETTGYLRRAWTAADTTPGGSTLRRTVSIPPLGLQGDLVVPPDPRGVILFAHGSGSSRLSPRNRAVAGRLNDLGFATLLMDLLTPAEAADRRNVFDIPLLADRLIEAETWIASDPELADLPLGLFGASTGAAAALVAAAELGARVSAVVSRGGRPDLAGPRLTEVTAPTLLIVGGEDPQVLEELGCEKLLRIVPGAGHLFEGPGELETVTDMAGAWFRHALTAD